MFTSLPTELTLLILRNLPLQTIWKLRRVSKSFKELCEEAFIGRIRDHPYPMTLQLGFITNTGNCIKVVPVVVDTVDTKSRVITFRIGVDVVYQQKHLGQIAFEKDVSMDRTKWCLRGLLSWNVDNVAHRDQHHALEIDNNHSYEMVPFEPMLSPSSLGVTLDEALTVTADASPAMYEGHILYSDCFYQSFQCIETDDRRKIWVNITDFRVGYEYVTSRFLSRVVNADTRGSI